MHRRAQLLAAILLLAAQPGSAAPLDDAKKQLVERFRAMADAYGLTADLYTRCEKKPELAKQIRASLEQAAERLQREASIKTSLKDVAERAYSAGRKRGSQLLCSDKPEEFASQMRQMTMNGLNESIARVNELKQQETAKPQ